MRKKLLCTLIAASLAWPLAAAAADVSSINQNIQRGNLSAALSETDALLKQNPKDPQLQFLRGVILTEQKKDAEAIQVFKQLTEQYPELPEPYNNLAVLYAQQGKYEQARAALEMAIRTNPSYATAQENLGDIYAKLASLAYQKALQLSPGDNAGTKLKLNLIRELFNQSGGGVAGSKPAATTPVAAHLPTESPKAEAAAAKSAAPQAAAKPSVVAVTKPAPAAPAHPAPQPAPPVAKAADKTPESEVAKPVAAAASDTDARAAIDAAVQQWAQAWSSKNLPGYFAAYAPNFQPEKGLSLAAWKEQRRRLIGDKKDISVVVKNLTVKVDGNTATARFRQIYNSGNIHFDGPKTLRFQLENGKWLIVREIAG